MTGNTYGSLISQLSLFPVASWLQTKQTNWQFEQDGGKYSTDFNDLIQEGND